MCIESGIHEAVKRNLEKDCEVTCELRSFYWLGFSSRNGSSKPKIAQHALKMRGRGGQAAAMGEEAGAAGSKDRGGAVSAHTTLTVATALRPYTHSNASFFPFFPFFRSNVRLEKKLSV